MRAFPVAASALLAAVLLVSAGCAPGGGQPPLTAVPPTSAATPVPTPAPVPVPTPTGPYARITNGQGRQLFVTLDVANTPETMTRGLMGRKSMPENAGMVFVFGSDQQAPFWMKDTLIPLSIAFISAEGRIVDIQEMEPLTEDLHRSANLYRYALEMNKGFFANNGVKAGDRVEFQLGGR